MTKLSLKFLYIYVPVQGRDFIFFDKSKRYSFIQIDGVHRYNTNSNSNSKRMNL